MANLPGVFPCFAPAMDSNLRAEQREEETLSIAREALFNSRVANIIAIMAIILSVATAIIITVIQPKP